MSKELIKITENESGQKLVSARELHKFLMGEDRKERFSQWFSRMLKYGFEENQDYTSVKKFTVVNNGAKRELQDYAITIDMSKELSMLDKSEKGKQARKYFIECEKIAKQVIPMLTKEQKLQLAIFNAKTKDETVLASAELDRYRQNQIKEKDGLLLIAGQKASFVDDFLSKDDLFSVDTISKTLGIKGLGRNNLYKYLRENKIIMTDMYEDRHGKSKAGLKHYTAFAQYVNTQQYFKHRQRDTQINGEIVNQNVAMLTTKGVEWLYKRLQKDNYMIEKNLEEIIVELKEMQQAA